MAYVNPIKARWAAGEAELGGWLVTSDVIAASFMAGCGFDDVCVDLQHSIVDPKDLVPLFLAIEAKGSVPIARVPANDFSMIGNVLDLGAQAVIIPMVNNGAEAARAVDACRFPPFGHRSAGWLRHPSTSGDVRDVENVACIVMVETADGLANCESIAAVPGVDCIYIGPGDLSLALGVPFDNRTPEQTKLFTDAVERVRRACDAAEIVAGMHCAGGRQARGYLDQGFRYLTVTHDITLISKGREDLAIVRGEA